MRNSDVVAGLAIIFGTVLGAHFSMHVNGPQTTHPVPHVHVVEVRAEPAEATATPVQPERERPVTLRVTSADPDRQARFTMVLDGYAEGETTRVVTPFTLTATQKGIAGTLTALEGDPELRAEVEMSTGSFSRSQTILIQGPEIWVDSEGVRGGTVAGSGR